jgi:putative RNA 2'-phosphotransferase
MQHQKHSRLKTRVSKYMSYLLRHSPQDLKMNGRGFIDLEELLEKLNERFQVDRNLVVEIVERSRQKRFEIVGNKIRALYGHTLPVKSEQEEDKVVRVLYHGTTQRSASEIVKKGLKPMKRRWVHLSPTKETAREVGSRRAENLVILEIDVEAARKNGLRFYKATDKVYLCEAVSPRYIRMLT